MKAVAMQPLTVQDYRRLPEGGPRFQLVEGEFFMAPAPNRYDQDVSRNLLVLLANHLGTYPLGRVYAAPFDVILDETNVFQPDLVFVSTQNFAILTEAGAEGAPDLVVEILSPKTAHLDRQPKRQAYARSGVEELWLVDPESRTVALYRLQEAPDQPVAVYAEPDSFTSRYFPDLVIHGSQVFRR